MLCLVTLRFFTSFLAYFLWVSKLHAVAYLVAQCVGLVLGFLAMKVMPTQTFPHVGSHQTCNQTPMRLIAGVQYGVHKSK